MHNKVSLMVYFCQDSLSSMPLMMPMNLFKFQSKIFLNNHWGNKWSILSFQKHSSIKLFMILNRPPPTQKILIQVLMAWMLFLTISPNLNRTQYWCSSLDLNVAISEKSFKNHNLNIISFFQQTTILMGIHSGTTFQWQIPGRMCSIGSISLICLNLIVYIMSAWSLWFIRNTMLLIKI